MAREPEYLVEQLGPDSFEVLVDGRALVYDAPSLDYAIEQIRRDGGSGYFFVHEDGYREERQIR